MAIRNDDPVGVLDDVAAPVEVIDTVVGLNFLSLADSFVEEADALIPSLPAIDRIVTSPLRRCRLLAERISRELDAPLSEDPRLQEMDFGRWEGMAWSAIPRSEIDAWAASFQHARPHGGESVSMLRRRVLEAIDDYTGRTGHTLIVTHAGIIKAALATGESGSAYRATISFGCFVTLIEEKKGAVI